MIYTMLRSKHRPERDTNWHKKDVNAQKIIVLSLDKKPLTHILNYETAQSMWTKLCSIYERESKENAH